MQVASEMLNRGNVNMATIAAEIGDESEAAFSRAFKKMMGVPPSAWRLGARASAATADNAVAWRHVIAPNPPRPLPAA